MDTKSRGIVYLVGAGPGDPGLLTVRGRELLADCDAVVFDALANPALLPAPDAEGRPERHDVGKRGGSAASARQDEINALLVALGRSGKRVVRLKGGDPLVFGRGSEEAEALRAAGVAFEIVPGVTAGIAAPAYAGIPVTHRGVATSVTFVTGHEDPAQPEGRTDWAALARAGGTIVLYMGVKTLPRIAAALAAGGMSLDTPAAAVQWGTHARQRTLVATLGTLAERAAAAGIGAPVITVIGPVVALRERIAWLEERPLFGARIVVTRAAAIPGGGRSGGMTERLR
ncbi:MAG TPA: uroporphyrinogen-III C-methyltransferase, partial [Gemmatimonadaceae bacterium]|nr:uroporphyrinogen-III C-methyltransferase [Gemmatimonadaceae bacterium]